MEISLLLNIEFILQNKFAILIMMLKGIFAKKGVHLHVKIQKSAFHQTSRIDGLSNNGENSFYWNFKVIPFSPKSFVKCY